VPGFFYLAVELIAFDQQVKKLLTQGVQHQGGFQLTQALLPAIDAVLTYLKHPTNRIDPLPFIEAL
jgi:hypothetical protein